MLKSSLIFWSDFSNPQCELADKQIFTAGKDDLPLVALRYPSCFIQINMWLILNHFLNEHV